MTKSYKTTLAVSAIAAMVVMVVAVAPFATNVDAKKALVCNSGPTAPTGPCPGESQNSPNRCEQVKAGQGGGSGSYKTPCEEDE
jgi:hypothetical protein